MQTTAQTELQWIELASCRFWARVHQLMYDTACTLELAIKAVQAADRANPARNN